MDQSNSSTSESTSSYMNCTSIQQHVLYYPPKAHKIQLKKGFPSNSNFNIPQIKNLRQNSKKKQKVKTEMYSGSNNNDPPPKDHVWTLGSHLLELFGKDRQIWPCWKCVTGQTLKFQTTDTISSVLSASSLCIKIGAVPAANHQASYNHHGL